MNSAAIAWIGVAVIINAWWIGYDLWAHFTGHWTMTRQMHDWLFNATVGPFFWASWAFVFVLALMHFAMAHYRH